jgi:phosphatidylinositol glycan class W
MKWIHQLRILDLSPSPSNTSSSALTVLPIDTGAFVGSIMDYKSAKEAFVADNPGTSIWTVNAVSLVGLVSPAATSISFGSSTVTSSGLTKRSKRYNQTSYYLYATQAQVTSRTSPWIDFITSILPLLLGQTVFSSHPIAFNIALAAISTMAWKLLSRKTEPVLGHESADLPTPPTIILEKKPTRTKSDKADLIPGLRPPQLGVPRIQRRRSPSLTPESDTHTIKINSPSPTSNTFPPNSSPDLTSTPRSTLDAATTSTSASTSAEESPPTNFPPQPFLSVYRAQMMLMTIVAILAVDFPVFPREFGKCEGWGTSLVSTDSFPYYARRQVRQSRGRRDADLSSHLLFG